MRDSANRVLCCLGVCLDTTIGRKARALRCRKGARAWSPVGNSDIGVPGRRDTCSSLGGVERSAPLEDVYGVLLPNVLGLGDLPSHGHVTNVGFDVHSG